MQEIIISFQKEVKIVSKIQRIFFTIPEKSADILDLLDLFLFTSNHGFPYFWFYLHSLFRKKDKLLLCLFVIVMVLVFLS